MVKVGQKIMRRAERTAYVRDYRYVSVSTLSESESEPYSLSDSEWEEWEL